MVDFTRLDKVLYDTAKTVLHGFFFRKDAIKSLTNFNKGNNKDILTDVQMKKLKKHYQHHFRIKDFRGTNVVYFTKINGEGA